MSSILFFINFFICTGMGKIFLQINSAAVAFIDILIAVWEGLIRNQSCLILLRDRQFTLWLITSLRLIISRGKLELISAQTFVFIGMEFLSVENIVKIPLDKVQSVLEFLNWFLKQSCFSQSFPVPSGTSKCYCSVCDTRQIALMSTSDGFVPTVETAGSTTDSLMFCNWLTKSWFYIRWSIIWNGGPTKTGSLRCSSQAILGNAHSLYRCQCLRLGCSSGTRGTIVSWSLDKRPIPTPHQCPRNDGYFHGSGKSTSCNPQHHCPDCDWQKTKRGDSFPNLVYGGLEPPILVSSKGNNSESQTYPWQI